MVKHVATEMVSSLSVRDSQPKRRSTSGNTTGVPLTNPLMEESSPITLDIAGAGDRDTLWLGKVETLLDRLPSKPLFDLVVTSPPYNIGKPYESTVGWDEYREHQVLVIEKILQRLKPTGSLCWQVGNFVDNSSRSGGRSRIYPLDYAFHPIFEERGLILRNRIIWRFGHGLHCRYRFSGRYETILWYTASNKYTFNLDAVRIPSKYPGKRHYKGPHTGEYSAHPNGKNPEDVWEGDWDDVWDIPNVKGNHVEKTIHPCQLPVGLVERLVLALTNEGDLVFDPYAGVASSGVAAVAHQRTFLGCEAVPEYVELGRERLFKARLGIERFRPHDQPIYDHTNSALSRRPSEFSSQGQK